MYSGTYRTVYSYRSLIPMGNITGYEWKFGELLSFQLVALLSLLCSSQSSLKNYILKEVYVLDFSLPIALRLHCILTLLKRHTPPGMSIRQTEGIYHLVQYHQVSGSYGISSIRHTWRTCPSVKTLASMTLAFSTKKI